MQRLAPVPLGCPRLNNSRHVRCSCHNLPRNLLPRFHRSERRGTDTVGGITPPSGSAVPPLGHCAVHRVSCDGFPVADHSGHCLAAEVICLTTSVATAAVFCDFYARANSACFRLLASDCFSLLAQPACPSLVSQPAYLLPWSSSLARLPPPVPFLQLAGSDSRKLAPVINRHPPCT